MSTLAEMETAVEALPTDQKRELFHFLAKKLQAGDASTGKARLSSGPGSVLVLEAPSNAPPMTTEIVREILADFP